MGKPAERAERGGLRSVLAHWLRSDADADAHRLQAQARAKGATAISEAPARQRVTLIGTLRVVRMQPRNGLPALEAEIYDGSGALTLCWLGRRHIPGITVGRQLRVTGLITTTNGRRVIFNPLYELLSEEE